MSAWDKAAEYMCGVAVGDAETVAVALREAFDAVECGLISGLDGGEAREELQQAWRVLSEMECSFRSAADLHRKAEKPCTLPREVAA